MKTVDLLIAAKARIQNPINWTKGTMYGAMDATSLAGQPAQGLLAVYGNNRRFGGVTRDKANCFCAVGACAFEANVHDPHTVSDSDGTVYRYSNHCQDADYRALMRAVKYLNEAANSLHDVSRVYVVNDTESHADVMEVFDLAIRNSKRRHANGKRYAKEAAK